MAVVAVFTLHVLVSPITINIWYLDSIAKKSLGCSQQKNSFYKNNTASRPIYFYNGISSPNWSISVDFWQPIPKRPCELKLYPRKAYYDLCQKHDFIHPAILLPNLFLECLSIKQRMRWHSSITCIICSTVPIKYIFFSAMARNVSYWSNISFSTTVL